MTGKTSSSAFSNVSLDTEPFLCITHGSENNNSLVISMSKS